jgi:adenylate cyclase class IV
MSMIEVELKFKLTEEEKNRLIENAQFIEVHEFTDEYYDRPDYSLSTNDIWLRTRNDTFLLKLPVQNMSETLKKQKNSPKHEVEDHCEILSHLNIEQEHEALKDNLATANIKPLYKFKNIRKKYSKEGFVIDLDIAFFDDFTYETCEIEIAVQDSTEVDEAIKKIEAFAQKHGIEVTHVEGRLIEYIKRKNPEHYKKLLLN